MAPTNTFMETVRLLLAANRQEALHDDQLAPGTWVAELTAEQRQAAWDDPFAFGASYEWEQVFPDHCFICHVASDDEKSCGPHCKLEERGKI